MKLVSHSFPDGNVLTANQIEFVNLIIGHSARSGWIAPTQLYESPFTDLHHMELTAWEIRFIPNLLGSMKAMSKCAPNAVIRVLESPFRPYSQP